MSHVLLCQGTALALPLRDASVACCVTSPPYYGLRSYGIGEGELGLEASPDAYVAAMVQVFREVKRVLRPDGTLWCNMGDSYAGGNAGGTYNPETWKYADVAGWTTRSQRTTLKTTTQVPAKNLLGLPWRVALALQADGWVLRSDIIWDKPSCMPESVQDRPTRSHEYVFLFSKAPQYYYDAEAIREPGSDHPATVMRNRHADASPPNGPKGTQAGIYGLSTTTKGAYRGENVTRNARTVWRIASESTSFAHFATFPTALVRRCLLAGAPKAVCSACSAPYRRIVERQRLLDGQPFAAQAFCPPTEPYRVAANGIGHARYSTQTTDHGFTATCTCAAGTQPATILDPFAGSGTTGLVARELGHNAVLLDLSYSYLRDIARQRLGLTALKAWQEGAAPRHERYDDLPLFAP